MAEEKLIIVEELSHCGFITLNRPKALNALSLPMIRTITAALLQWKDSPQIKRVAIRGMGKQPDGSFAPFGAFCAGGDIRFFHQAALAGDPALEDFFTEEYSLNHLIHTYPKPYVVFMDGINMGGGMGISGHGAASSIRIATERTKMAMPETNIGLFPDVGGGWFLSRCGERALGVAGAAGVAQPGVGEYLALTGQMLHAPDALRLGLADVAFHSDALAGLWDQLGSLPAEPQELLNTIKNIAKTLDFVPGSSHFSYKNWHLWADGDMKAIIARLEASSDAQDLEAAAVLRKRSPLMLHVTLELVRRARSMQIADELRLERDLVRHCFHTKHLQRSGAATETVEGVRALAVDKDHTPKWNPGRIEDVTLQMVEPFFASPWPASAHPLRNLS
jgi:enoyl-CoA hydratase/carnithine racemase